MKKYNLEEKELAADILTVKENKRTVSMRIARKKVKIVIFSF